MRARRRSVAVFSLLGTAALLAAVAQATSPPARPAAKAKTKDRAVLVDLGELHAEVSALQVLHGLRPGPAQLQALARLAPKTMQPAPPRKLVRAADGYRLALRALREALLTGADAEVEKKLASVDEQASRSPPELEEIELSDEARRQAPKLVRGLSPRQVARYLATVGDFPDPLDQLAGAVAAARQMRGHKWTDHRDDVAYLVGWLLAGVDAAAEEKARARAAALLSKAHTASDKDFDRAALLREAEAMTRAVPPTDVLRHYMERVVAELLSNHKLADALAAWGKKR